jgi:hypothetical protein
MEAGAPHWIRPEIWLEVLRREYLVDFVQPGGSAVKVVIAREQPDYDSLDRGLHAAAQEHGFVFASINSKTTKAHLIDRLFHAVAAQIPWKRLADSYVRRLLEPEYRLPAETEPLTMENLAVLNERDEAVLDNDIKKLLEKALISNFRMCQEFRFAMMEMCLEALQRGRLTDDAVIEDWLRGDLRLISALKPCLIFQKVARHNARHMLLSTAHWVRLAGKQGLILTIDIGRYLIEKRPQEPDGSLYYSRSAVIEAYEVLRQLIDGTDDTEGCLIVVFAPTDFLGNDKRGLRAYEALRFRVEDEVWDRRMPNPLAALIRISHKEEALDYGVERSPA